MPENWPCFNVGHRSASFADLFVCFMELIGMIVFAGAVDNAGLRSTDRVILASIT
jgi:hypothetical protein